MSETVPCRHCGRQTAFLGTKECDPCHELRSSIERAPALARQMVAAITLTPALDRAAVMRATLKRIAEGQVMWGTYSHAETVLTYQRIARETLAQLGEPS